MIVLADERCRRKRVARRAARGCAAGERHGTCSKREGEFGLGDSAHGRSSWQAIRSARVANARRSKADADLHPLWRSEEHTSELQSLMRISYAVFCLKKKQNTKKVHTTLH